MRSIHVSVCHDDDAVVSQSFDVEFDTLEKINKKKKKKKKKRR